MAIFHPIEKTLSLVPSWTGILAAKRDAATLLISMATSFPPSSPHRSWGLFRQLFFRQRSRFGTDAHGEFHARVRDLIRVRFFVFVTGEITGAKAKQPRSRDARQKMFAPERKDALSRQSVSVLRGPGRQRRQISVVHRRGGLRRFAETAFKRRKKNTNFLLVGAEQAFVRFFNQTVFFA